MKFYNKNDLFWLVKNGLAVLPKLFEYNSSDPSQEPIELSEEETISYVILGLKKYIKYPDPLNQTKRIVYITTLSRQGFEKYKEDLWKEFDYFQTNNKPRYVNSRKVKSKICLTKQDFFNCYEKDFKLLETNTLAEMYIAEKKIEKLKFVIEKYNLPYEEYKKDRLEQKELNELKRASILPG